MPLHLLPKKSWNVYNPAAIAKVRADEAAEAAREEAEEQRQDEYDAARRLAILRGLPPPPSPSPPPPREVQKRTQDVATSNSKHDSRKRRRLNGEDDTDRDIRLARQDREERNDLGKSLDHKKTDHVAPLMDHAGHIQLFAPPLSKEIRATKNAEAKHERQVKESAEQDALRFSDASGLKKNIKDMPWYATSRAYSGTEELDNRYIHEDDRPVGKDAFGRDDPSRGKRDAARIASADPMAMMRQAQTRLKEVERERNMWKKERDRELEELRAGQEREERRQRKRHARHEEPGVDGFSLDNPTSFDSGRPTEAERQRHHHRRRSRSRERTRQPQQGETWGKGRLGDDRHRRRHNEEPKSRIHSTRDGDRRMRV